MREPIEKQRMLEVIDPYTIAVNCNRAILCGSRKYPYLPHGWFFTLNPSRNSSLASYFPLKILAFENPHLLGISSEYPWGGQGVDIFWSHTL